VSAAVFRKHSPVARMNIEPTKNGKLAAWAAGMNRKAPIAVTTRPDKMPNL
jgi:hypothetical protein